MKPSIESLNFGLTLGKFTLHKISGFIMIGCQLKKHLDEFALLGRWDETNLSSFISLLRNSQGSLLQISLIQMAGSGEVLEVVPGVSPLKFGDKC